ncbi:MAG: pyridoxamine 5'-phosphate oxidase family protein, partial [Bacteroidales bacterium]|nr:pyridoxamine 5'-phosphate oxidase family protein [Bacteroidales bacterium]
MRRKDREMDSEFGKQIIDAAEYGVLSMIDGKRPYGLPLSIVRSEDLLYFHSAKAGRKVDVLGNNSNVSVVFVGDNKIPENYSPNQLEEMNNDATKAIQFISSVFTTEYESAIVTGAVMQVMDEAEKMKAMRLICEKYTPDKMKYFDTAIRAGLKRTNVYKIEIDNIAAKRKKYD